MHHACSEDTEPLSQVGYMDEDVVIGSYSVETRKQCYLHCFEIKYLYLNTFHPLNMTIIIISLKEKIMLTIRSQWSGRQGSLGNATLVEQLGLGRVFHSE